MPMGRGGGGHDGQNKGSCKSFTLSRIQKAWPNLAPPLIKSINNLAVTEKEPFFCSCF